MWFCLKVECSAVLKQLHVNAPSFQLSLGDATHATMQEFKNFCWFEPQDGVAQRLIRISDLLSAPEDL